MAHFSSLRTAPSSLFLAHIAPSFGGVNFSFEDKCEKAAREIREINDKIDNLMSKFNPKITGSDATAILTQIQALQKCLPALEKILSEVCNKPQPPTPLKEQVKAPDLNYKADKQRNRLPDEVPTIGPLPAGQPLPEFKPLTNEQVRRQLELLVGEEAVRRTIEDVARQQQRNLPFNGTKDTWRDFRPDAPELIDPKYAAVPLAIAAVAVTFPAWGAAIPAWAPVAASLLVAGGLATTATGAPVVSKTAPNQEEIFHGKTLKLTNATVSGGFYGTGGAATDVSDCSVYADAQGLLYVPAKFISGAENMRYTGFSQIKLPDGARDIVTYDGKKLSAVGPLAITLVNLPTGEVMGPRGQ